MDTSAAIEILREICADYAFEPLAIYKAAGKHEWPLVAQSDADLAGQLAEGGHFLPLPKEPAALANIVEVAVVDFLLDRLSGSAHELTRGTERGYPDLEMRVGQVFLRSM